MTLDELRTHLIKSNWMTKEKHGWRFYGDPPSPPVIAIAKDIKQEIHSYDLREKDGRFFLVLEDAPDKEIVVSKDGGTVAIFDSKERILLTKYEI